MARLRCCIAKCRRDLDHPCAKIWQVRVGLQCVSVHAPVRRSARPDRFARRRDFASAVFQPQSTILAQGECFVSAERFVQIVGANSRPGSANSGAANRGRVLDAYSLEDHSLARSRCRDRCVSVKKSSILGKVFPSCRAIAQALGWTESTLKFRQQRFRAKTEAFAESCCYFLGQRAPAAQKLRNITFTAKVFRQV